MKAKYEVTVRVKAEGIPTAESDDKEFIQKTSIGFELDDEKALAFLESFKAIAPVLKDAFGSLKDSVKITTFG